MARSNTLSLDERATLDQPEFWAAELDEVHDVFAQMRREQPVYWYEPAGFWVMSKYEDQRYVGANPELFSSNYGFLLVDNFDPAGIAPQLPEWAQEPLTSGRLSPLEARQLVARAKLSMGDPDIEHLIVLDPPRHGQFRKILTRALSQRVIRSLGPFSQEVTDKVLDGIQEGEVHDFVDAVSARIPADVMAALMEIPEDQRERFFRGSAAFMESFNITPDSDPLQVERLTRLSEDFVAYQSELIADRVAHPGDDLVSRVVESQVDGERLSHNVAMMFTMSLITGGSDTTKHLMSQMGQALVEHPEQREILLERPELIPNAVEEVLRYYPVAWHECRTATERLEIRGQIIEKGDFVMLPFSSGNRDEDVWERPDEFDVTRTFDAGHQAFGWGAHLCPGASLSRLETTVLLQRLLARFPRWELAGEPVRFTSPVQNGIVSMPVRFRS